MHVGESKPQDKICNTMPVNDSPFGFASAEVGVHLWTLWLEQCLPEVMPKLAQQFQSKPPGCRKQDRKR